jgi:type IV pilus assembly protein PilW
MMPYPAVCPFPRGGAARERGMTLIELMVALLIGLLLGLAMMRALVFGEAQRRTTNATSAVDLSGAYAASALDTALRNAGSALMQSVTPLDIGIVGCNPGFAASLPAPFDQFLGGDASRLRVAPLLIQANPSGATPASDVLAVMSGSGATGGLPRSVVSVSGSTLTLNNAIGIGAPSIALMPLGGGVCSILNISAVDAGAAQLTLSAAPATTPATLLPLGNPAVGDVQFQLLGVNPATAALTSYDLLTNTARPMAGNVLAMQALYGVADNTGKLAQWVAPTTATGYDIDTLMASPAKLTPIVAVRVALILKGSLYEKEAVSAGKSLSWFSPVAGASTDLAGIPFSGLSAAAQTWTPAANSADEHYRYGVVEFVVPVRNGMIVN